MLLDFKLIVSFVLGAVLVGVIAHSRDLERAVATSYGQGQVDCMRLLAPEVIAKMTPKVAVK